MNMNEVKRGKVRCGHIVYFRAVTEESKKHPVIENFVNINVTSGNNGKWRYLSPMLLGPFNVIEPLAKFPAQNLYTEDGVHPGFVKISDTHQRAMCTNIENYWQFSKIMNIDIDTNHLIKSSFFERRAKGFNDVKPHRRAIPKAKGHAIAAYFNSGVYNYLDSRFFYCDMYEKIVLMHPLYKELEKMLGDGISLHIIGYDGRDIPINKDSLNKEYRNPDFPFGHELVLCCLLSKIYPWKQNK